MEQPEPKTLVKRLIDAGMTQTQIAAELTSSGVPVTQPTINRIKKGSGTSYEIGMALLRLSQSRIKSKRSASALNA
jgi:arginine repressor